MSRSGFIGARKKSCSGPANSALKYLVHFLTSIPFLGPVRVAMLIALVQTPHRFRTKRQLWAYSGLALETHGSGEYRFVNGQFQRSRRAVAVRGLNQNHNHELKHLFKSAATTASVRGPFRDFYDGLLAKGMKPSMARLTLARKIAAITHYFDPLEERSKFRPGSTETTSSLSVWPRAPSIPRVIPVVAIRVLETLGFEVEYP